jgi:prepilin-type N-terminal cleavage/methylation domain-containing protein
MVFKITSIKARRCRGVTLAELLVSIAVGSILFLAVAVLGIYAGRSFAGLVNYTDLDARSRHALDTLTRDVRQVNRLVSNTSTTLTFEDADGASLQYVFSPDDRTLSRVKGGRTEVLLTECDDLNFSIFQRNPIGGTYDQYPTASAATTKLINVTWTCSRKILGTTMNTENVQTAKVVIRKQ